MPHTPLAAKPSVEIVCSAHFLSWLHAEHISLAVTTYQTNRLFLLGLKADGVLSGFERLFDRPMGLHAAAGRLTMATRFQLWQLDDVLPSGRTHEGYDALFVPHRATTTGEVDAHDVAVGADGRVVFVNTLYSCLATTSEHYSFKPLWKPPFISALVPEERCHLNGLAMRDGQPAYVTAVSRSDVVAGWRERRADGGVVVDVASGEVVCGGLSMPHSPRWHRGRLWVLNSGTGELGWIDLQAGRFEPVAFVPGYGRGLAFHDRYAVVGLSKPREDRVFAGLPLDARLRQKDAVPRCGLYVVDLDTGMTVHWLQFEGVVTELYDVQVLEGVRRPTALGFKTDEIRRLVTVELPDGPAMHSLTTLKETEAGSGPAPEVLKPAASPGPATPPPSAGPFTFAAGTGTLAEAAARFGGLIFPPPDKLDRQSAFQESLVGVVALHEGRPVGLALAGLSPDGSRSELLSLFVARERRNQGAATALLERTEAALAARGCISVEARYRTSWPEHGAFEKVLRKRGWDAPRTAQHLFKMESDRIGQAPWLAAADVPLPPEYEVFPWLDLTAAERRAILEEQARTPWFPPVLSPFQMEDRVEPMNSMGLRRHGAVVGWIITHRMRPELIQCTSLFVREGVPRGRIITLLAEAIRRQCRARVPLMGFIVEASNAEMLRFAERRMKPYIVSQGEVRVVGKHLP